MVRKSELANMIICIVLSYVRPNFNKLPIDLTTKLINFFG